MTLEHWREWMGRDKKVTDGAVRFVLLDGLGRAVARSNVGARDLEAALAR